jgi:hypothetical protein
MSVLSAKKSYGALGVEFLHMNGVAIEALKKLYRAERRFIDSAPAQLAKERVLALGPRRWQVSTKFMQEEIDFWKFLASRHRLPPAVLLMWAFAVSDLAGPQNEKHE